MSLGSKPSEKEWTLFVCPTCGYVTPVRLTAGGPEHESFFTCDGTLKLVEDDRGFYEKAASHEPIACERVRVAPVEDERTRKMKSPDEALEALLQDVEYLTVAEGALRLTPEHTASWLRDAAQRTRNRIAAPAVEGEAGETIALEVCPEKNCALPRGHGAGYDGLHVPLPVLWQEAGYVEGPWSKPLRRGVLGSSGRPEKETG